MACWNVVCGLGSYGSCRPIAVISWAWKNWRMLGRHPLRTIGWAVTCCTAAGMAVVVGGNGPDWLFKSLFIVFLFTAAGLARFGNLVRTWKEARQHYALLGPIRSWVILLSTILFFPLLIGGQSWLSSYLGWPEAYGFTCSEPERYCIGLEWSHSGLLLQNGDPYELGLFALLWAFPAAFVGFVIWVIIKGRRR